MPPLHTRRRMDQNGRRAFVNSRLCNHFVRDEQEPKAMGLIEGRDAITTQRRRDRHGDDQATWGVALLIRRKGEGVLLTYRPRFFHLGCVIEAQM